MIWLVTQAYKPISATAAASTHLPAFQIAADWAGAALLILLAQVILLGRLYRRHAVGQVANFRTHGMNIPSEPCMLDDHVEVAFKPSDHNECIRHIGRSL
jgi:hypothetical protein